MKALLVIILSIVGMARAQDPSSFCTETSGYYPVPSPTNCRDFIMCTGSVGSVLRCPDDKWFDVDFKACLPQSIAKCEHVPVLSVPEWVVELCRQLPGTGQSIPAETCDHYYVCFGVNVFELSCGNGQHYSRAYSACMNPIDAGCKALNTMCLDEVPGYEFPGQRCEEYYSCGANYLPIYHTCDPGLYYNYNNGNCTTPELSNCANPVTSVPTTPTPTTKSTTPSTTKTSTESTTKTTTESTTKTTTESTTKNTTLPITTTEPTVAPPVCNANNTGTFFKHPDCTKFYMCYESAALAFDCSANEYFDPSLGYCTPNKSVCS